jgi:hypothetical protein
MLRVDSNESQETRMRHEIPRMNWMTHLADAIRAAADGDTIVCRTADAVELAKQAHGRMCPNKTILWEIQA